MSFKMLQFGFALFFRGPYSTCPIAHAGEGRWVPHVLASEGPIFSSLPAACRLRCGKHIELGVHPMERLAPQAVPEAASGRFRETWTVELASGVSAIRLYNYIYAGDL